MHVTVKYNLVHAKLCRTPKILSHKTENCVFTPFFVFTLLKVSFDRVINTKKNDYYLFMSSKEKLLFANRSHSPLTTGQVYQAVKQWILTYMDECG